MRTRGRLAELMIVVGVVVLVGGCHKKVPPVARPVPPPPPAAETPAKPPEPAEPVAEPTTVVPQAPVNEEGLAERTLDEINRKSPLRPAFFDYDSAEISAEAQHALDGNAEVLKKNSSWVITIEGHCDERGTAEYNLALGERRAVAARSYLMSLGIPGDHLRTVSYGKEFPFDPAHTEDAWAKNRRAHFVVTQK
jgi:peptidoglycan-associated lipoprotein